MRKMIEFEQVTPERLFFSRRKFLRLAAMFGTAYALAACGVPPTATPEATSAGTPIIPTLTLPAGEAGGTTPYEYVTGFVNFFEFATDKYTPVELSKNLKLSPWPIEIGGLVKKPQTVDAADLIKKYGSEERIYRHRCVEAWSMVVPWNGFQLNKLLADLQVDETAKFVKFTTLLDTDQMPGEKTYYFPWPYVEGLRLDEAQNDLALLVSGVYGKPLPPQNGAPLRLVVPWKYGFKGIKSIVKIELVAEQPETFWPTAVPGEYGFYANVNPNVSHPRWSQATETHIGTTGLYPTLMFNGYADQVAYLYEGMDLTVNY